MTDATSPPAPLKQHLWVLLALVAVGLAWFSLVDFGNTVGVDEWAFLNAVAHGSVAHAADNRPLGLLAHLAAWNLLGPHPLAAQIFYLFVRLGTAFMIYGLVERYWRDRPLFAFTCAAVYLVLIVDSWLLLQPYALLTYPSALLLALVALFCYQQYEGDGAPRWLWLAPGLVAGFASAMMTEATLSLLTGLPVLMFIARRPPTRGRFIGLGVWLITAIGAAIRYVAPVLGLSGATYASRMLVSLTPGYLIGNLLAQISIAFKDLVLAEPALIYRHALAAAVMAATMLIGMAAASRYLPTDEPTLPGRPAWQRHLVWLGIGLAAMLLGLALFLPTVIARDPRAQVLALPGGAVILASVVWLAGELVGAHLRSGVRYAAVVAMAVTSATRTAAIQDELYFYGGTWETQAIYLRTLAHIAPAVRDNTLFAYIEQPQQAEVPFVSGWAFATHCATSTTTTLLGSSTGIRCCFTSSPFRTRALPSGPTTSSPTNDMLGRWTPSTVGTRSSSSAKTSGASP